MTRAKSALLALIAICLTVPAARAQQPLPATQNAALRYWMAFAMMQDPLADPDTQALLLAVANSNAPWDDQKFGPIVEQNREAILTLQRATALPECNWGLDYDLGPETPIAHLAKARVLARLNALYGMHQLFRQDSNGAVDTWIAGLRFSRHLAQGASLIGALTANASLTAHLRAMQRSIESGTLRDEAAISRIDAAVKALPAYGLDWSDAVRMESAATVIGFQQFARSSDPKRLYETWFGEQPPAALTVPTSGQIIQYQALMEKVALEFQQTYAELPEIASLQSQIGGIHPVIGRSLPSLTRLSNTRREAGQVRRALLDIIATRRR